ncbi:MAG: hypothetical protein IPM26_02835 [Saprospiraceae bacterium]|nr:hypothetical protein [Saprospiraceae bacterium]
MRLLLISIQISTILLLLTSFLSCKKDECRENPKTDCFCTEQYDPVCGCNNKTYGNACHANCAGITDFVKGECK